MLIAASRSWSSVRTLACRATPLRRWKQSVAEPQASPLPAASLKTADSTKPPPLEKLSKPLGVTGKPSAIPKSWEEKRAELLDYNIHLEKRRHLVKQATKGYYEDFGGLRHHEGKTWIAPNSLIREDKALYFPDVTGVSLTPQETVHTTSIFEGRISIISMISSTRSEEHVKSFTTSALEAHQSNPLFRFLQVNLQENPLKGFLVSLFLSAIRSRTAVHLQSTYIVSRQNMEYLREPMGMTNKHVGYVYLVDEKCRIRWAGCGFAAEEEPESLRICTRVLLQRLEKIECTSKDP
ncbi:hypothetical protein K439DRAFT_1630891 [Ramaria rubella]|nr:hypothetical protein K439DRAFT_1630891 [Ramaria rubella]